MATLEYFNVEKYYILHKKHIFVLVEGIFVKVIIIKIGYNNIQ